MSDTSENAKMIYMKSSSIRFDISIPKGHIFGVEGDLYCRHMFERADLYDANIDPWKMWQRVSRNVVACKFCRLYTNTGYITHECGFWERTGERDGKICFCFCHDNLGYALNDDDPFVFCDFKTLETLTQILRLDDMMARDLLWANELHIVGVIGRQPDFGITYDASRNGVIILTDDDSGTLHPSQILSIRAFSGLIRYCNTFKANVQVYRGTTLGQFVTMQSKRYFQRCSKSLWILVGDKELAIVMHLQVLCLRALARSKVYEIAVAPNLEATQIQMQLA